MLRLTFYGLYGKIRLYYRIEKGGEEMDNCTFKTAKTEGDEVWSDILEEYRFVFLRYLEIARELFCLEKESKYVAVLKQFLANGWSFDRPIDEVQTVTASGILRYKYDAEYSQVGFEKAIKQFEADLSLAKAQEEYIWQNLTEVVDRIDLARDYAGYDISGKIWYSDSSEEQRHLIVGDIVSPDRIRCYEKELSNFSQKPLLPYTQEVTFKYYQNGLALV